MLLIDTSAIIAVLSEDDRYNLPAGKIWTKLVQENETIVCNNYILVEAASLIQRRYGMKILRHFQDTMIPLLTVHWLTEQDHAEAMGILLVASRRKLSLVDCSAFVTMRHWGVRQAFTFDSHFAEQGFEVVRGA
jgi:predicted nucleic acid-binding protein